MFNAIRQHAVSWPLAIGEEPSDGEQKRHWGGWGGGLGGGVGWGSGFQVISGMIEGFS